MRSLRNQTSACLLKQFLEMEGKKMEFIGKWEDRKVGRERDDMQQKAKRPSDKPVELHCTLAS